MRALTVLALAATIASTAHADRPAPCPAAGQWLLPADGETIAFPRLVDRLAARAVVLLGEHHGDAEHHLWELATIAVLLGRRSDIVLGFEAFPREAQPVLDRWTRGELSEAELLKGTRWHEVWGYDAEPYLPLFRLARQHRVPMLALNVDRSLIERVGKQGWQAIPEQDRHGLSDPAPPTEAYRRSLAGVFALKRQHAVAGAEVSPEEVERALRDPRLKTFVDAQLTWDRAMAEAIAAALTAAPPPLVVAVMGRGHVEHGWGVPHQLRDLGVADVAVLLPERWRETCSEIPGDVADALFLIDAAERREPPRPRLGVMVETAPRGVRITAVADGSIAMQAGLRADDVIVSAAGRPLEEAAELIAIVKHQAPGTWLPLTVLRDAEELELVARFAPRSDRGE